MRTIYEHFALLASENCLSAGPRIAMAVLSCGTTACPITREKPVACA